MGESVWGGEKTMETLSSSLPLALVQSLGNKAKDVF